MAIYFRSPIQYIKYLIIIGDSGSGKTNALLNLINNQLGIDEIYLHAKYQYLITKR